ncbi:ABC transporter ATP-binding protein [Actinoplanes sp. NBRC 103695]|uniref:ABC transporter ATP-binding protein n=1 Tax=Actinoplanes sp. NBRC 103695 TaxID=3032202 RepID=UPI00255293D6|nr:ABC transporter ATP-binding protein [Actinoplanes sp. NBRC 103695]
MEVREVAKVYPGGVHALDRVSLRVEPGEFVGIVGPSGSGKSTLLHIMGTLERATGGTVLLSGHDVGDLPDRRLSAVRGRLLGFVFQQCYLTAGLTAVENVCTGLMYAGVAASRRRSLALAALDRVGLAARIGHRPHEMSGGERQRVAIARALVHEPALILADEPTGALDGANGAGVLALLRRLNEEGTTIAVITHDREIAAELPRRVEVRDGRIVSDVRQPAGSTA